MGYRFKDHETVPDVIKRIALELIDNAVESTKQKRKTTPKSSDTKTPFCDAGRRLLQVRDTTAMIEALDGLTARYADQLELDAFAELRKSFMITRRRHQADQHKAMADVGPFPIKKRENTMIIRQTCVYLVMVSGILLFAGCAFRADEPQGGAQFDSTLGSQSKSLAGSYGDIGSDGSIKPHPESSYKMSQEPQSRTDGAITLGGPAAIPDLRTGTLKRSTGGTTPRSGSGANSTGSSSGASGADGQ
jgi:hypothetical protein